MIEIKRVGDIIKSLSVTPDKEVKPKKIIYELSECRTYYNCQIYYDMIDGGEIREGIIALKTLLFAYFNIVLYFNSNSFFNFVFWKSLN